MTALAQPRVAAPSAVAPATASAMAALRRVTGTWAEPEPWTVAILLATGLAVLARHPITDALGTAGPSPRTPSAHSSAGSSALAPRAVIGAAATTPLAAVAPAPTHAPRDPFRALVDQDGNVVAPQAVTLPALRHSSTAPTTSPTSTTTGPSAAAGSGTVAACAGTVHRVVTGDTLWSLAARVVRTGDAGRVDVVWHRIYAANRTVVGADPSLLPVGVRLCLPSAR